MLCALMDQAQTIKELVELRAVIALSTGLLNKTDEAIESAVLSLL